jgi:hypothetical protein
LAAGLTDCIPGGDEGDQSDTACNRFERLGNSARHDQVDRGENPEYSVNDAQNDTVGPDIICFRDTERSPLF